MIVFYGLIFTDRAALQKQSHSLLCAFQGLVLGEIELAIKSKALLV